MIHKLRNQIVQGVCYAAVLAILALSLVLELLAGVKGTTVISLLGL